MATVSSSSGRKAQTPPHLLHIDGLSNPPEKQIDNTVNTIFLLWKGQDQILASWILSTLSEGLLGMMVGLRTSREIWDTLETSFSSQSKARLMQYKQFNFPRSGSRSSTHSSTLSSRSIPATPSHSSFTASPKSPVFMTSLVIWPRATNYLSLFPQKHAILHLN